MVTGMFSGMMRLRAFLERLNNHTELRACRPPMLSLLNNCHSRRRLGIRHSLSARVLSRDTHRPFHSTTRHTLKASTTALPTTRVILNNSSSTRLYSRVPLGRNLHPLPPQSKPRPRYNHNLRTDRASTASSTLQALMTTWTISMVTDRVSAASLPTTTASSCMAVAPRACRASWVSVRLTRRLLLLDSVHLAHLRPRTSPTAAT